MTNQRLAIWSGVAVLFGVIGWGYYEYREAAEYREKLELAEQFYNGCIAERKKLNQAFYLCRSWSYQRMAGASSSGNRDRLLTLAQASALSSAETCHRELETRKEQLRQFENEVRGQDGMYRYKGDSDMQRHTELRRLIETIGIDCNSLDYDIKNRVHDITRK